MDKMLITGASGFVGSWLVEEALQHDIEVYAGIRSSSSLQWLRDDRIKLVELDLSDSSSLKEHIAHYNFEYIIHNAGLTKALKNRDLIRVNVDYTKNLATASLKSTRLKKFSFMSSMAAYGTADYQPGGLVSNASDPHPITSYGKSKLRAEQELLKIDGLPLLIFRPTGIFGPRERDFLNLFQTINRGLALQVGFTEQQLSLIYVKDLVRVIMQASLAGFSNRAYFVSDGNLYLGSKFNRLVAESLDTQPWKIKIPIPLASAIATLSDMSSKITGKVNILSRDKLPELKSRNMDCDISNLVQDYDFKPQYTLQKAIQETTDWYRANDWL